MRRAHTARLALVAFVLAGAPVSRTPAEAQVLPPAAAGKQPQIVAHPVPVMRHYTRCAIRRKVFSTSINKDKID